MRQAGKQQQQQHTHCGGACSISTSIRSSSSVRRSNTSAATAAANLRLGGLLSHGTLLSQHLLARHRGATAAAAHAALAIAAPASSLLLYSDTPSPRATVPGAGLLRSSRGRLQAPVGRSASPPDPRNWQPLRPCGCSGRRDHPSGRRSGARASGDGSSPRPGHWELASLHACFPGAVRNCVSKRMRLR